MALFGKRKKEDDQALQEGMSKTRSNFLGKLSRAVAGRSTVDIDVLDDLEQLLVESDVGINTTVKIIERIEERVAKDKYLGSAELNQILKEEIAALLQEKDAGVESADAPQPYILLVVGVNGVGKTTTIGKLAKRYMDEGKKVVLGAADTFRAAAVDQLILWGERTGATVISHGMNTDPASVAFDTVKQGVEQNADIIIIDTAGRLHTKVNLMNELAKIKRVAGKQVEGSPHEVMLVLDGSTGQNALIQAREFSKATDISSLAITKLDGTAKGGVIIGISDELQVPVRWIGVGERPEDLQPFDRQAFVESLF